MKLKRESCRAGFYEIYKGFKMHEKVNEIINVVKETEFTDLKKYNLILNRWRGVLVTMNSWFYFFRMIK